MYACMKDSFHIMTGISTLLNFLIAIYWTSSYTVLQKGQTSSACMHVYFILLDMDIQWKHAVNQFLWDSVLITLNPASRANLLTSSRVACMLWSWINNLRRKIPRIHKVKLNWKNGSAWKSTTTRMSAKQLRNTKGMAGVSTRIKRLAWVRDQCHSKLVIICCLKKASNWDKPSLSFPFFYVNPECWFSLHKFDMYYLKV